MVIKLRQYIRDLTLFGLLIFAAYILFGLFTAARFTPTLSWFIVPFFYSVVLASWVIINIGKGRSSRRFGSRYLGVTMVRFMLYVGVLMVYSFSFPQDAVVFIITFFIVYFAFTLFEVSYLYRALK